MSRRDQLAGFHQTISEQLNSRLEESPRFFWALVVVSTGYGYVLWSYAVKSDAGSHAVATIASVLSYFAILWASWYLAALGYAFRFLKNCQHRIEYALGWHQYAPESREPSGVFGLLPSIYHAHIFGMYAFLTVLFASFWWLWQGHTCVVIVGAAGFLVGLLFIIGINWAYLWKFRGRRRRPDQVKALDN